MSSSKIGSSGINVPQQSIPSQQENTPIQSSSTQQPYPNSQNWSPGLTPLQALFGGNSAPIAPGSAGNASAPTVPEYAPPTYYPNNPAGSTDPGVFMSDSYVRNLNLNGYKQQANTDNRNTWMNYQNDLSNWKLNVSQGNPPAPPQYETVDEGKFNSWFDALQQSFRNQQAVDTSSSSFMSKSPAPLATPPQTQSAPPQPSLVNPALYPIPTGDPAAMQSSAQTAISSMNNVKSVIDAASSGNNTGYSTSELQQAVHHHRGYVSDYSQSQQPPQDLTQTLAQLQSALQLLQQIGSHSSNTKVS